MYLCYVKTVSDDYKHIRAGSAEKLDKRGCHIPFCTV